MYPVCISPPLPYFFQIFKLCRLAQKAPANLAHFNKKAHQTAGLKGMFMDIGTIFAIIISAVAVLSTIIGPMITAKITCRHEEKMYKKRFLTEHEHEAIERYLQTVGRYAFGENYEDKKDLGNAISEIFMYAPKELWDDIKSINEQLTNFMVSSYHSGDREQQKARLCKSYLSLCEKFAALRRSDEQQKNKRSKKNKK